MNSLIPAISAIIGFIFTAVIGYIFIPFLRKLHFGQTILEIGPKWHKSKQGTPIMGGLMFICGMLVAIVCGYILATVIPGNERLITEITVSRQRLVQLIAGIMLALLMSFIGFMDEYIKAVKKQNLGLKASQKTFLQLLVSVAYLYTMFLGGMRTTVLPFFGEIDITSGFGLLFWPIALVFIYGFTIAVNLTDGIDGLCGSVTLIYGAAFVVIGGILNFFATSFTAAALAGSLLGFLVWNFYPAKVFMGDTGSMYLGGAVVALAFMANEPMLIFIAGLLYFIEAFSVILQILSVKLRGKRIFKMSPIHHHFEMSDWSEIKIVVVFSAFTLVCCIISILSVI